MIQRVRMVKAISNYNNAPKTRDDLEEIEINGEVYAAWVVVHDGFPIEAAEGDECEYRCYRSVRAAHLDREEAAYPDLCAVVIGGDVWETWTRVR